MKNHLLILPLVFLSTLASAQVPSVVCEEIGTKPTVVVSYNATAGILGVYNGNDLTTFSVLSISEGSGVIDSVINAESRVDGGVQFNLGQSISMLYQKRLNKISYLKCTGL